MNRKRTSLRIAALAALIVSLAACAGEANVIGIQRPVYTEEESVITVHFFRVQSEAEAYYRERGADEYFLFTTPFDDAEEVFAAIDGEPAPDGGKTLHFTEDEESSAIEQVVEFIEERDLQTIRSVVE